MPNFFIDKFRIPPFLLPIYQAAGMQYGIRWEVLAGINEIETDYGRNLNVSSAGALGWMQFMPATWKQYGVDANQDGVKDPFNPVDAIFAAARYLKAAGGDKDLRRAIFAYNHADWYVDSVLMRAQVIGGIPGDLVGSLTGLTQGRFPVRAKATYAGALKKADRKTQGRQRRRHGRVRRPRRKGIEIYAKAGSPVIAVNDGKVVKHRPHASASAATWCCRTSTATRTRTRTSKSVAKTYPSPKPRKAKSRQRAPSAAAPNATDASRAKDDDATHGRKADAEARRRPRPPRRPPRSACSPTRSARTPAPPAATRSSSDADAPPPAPRSASNPKDFRRQAARQGRPRARRHHARPDRQDQADGKAPHLLFEIRPAGRGAPRIDPKPILDGWKLLESTAIYRAKGKNALLSAPTPRSSRSARSC